MDILIDPALLADRLAINAVIDETKEDYESLYEKVYDDFLKEEYEVLKPEIQEIYNRWYDYFYNMIVETASPFNDDTIDEKTKRWLEYISPLTKLWEMYKKENTFPKLEPFLDFLSVMVFRENSKQNTPSK